MLLCVDFQQGDALTPDASGSTRLAQRWSVPRLRSVCRVCFITMGSAGSIVKKGQAKVGGAGEVLLGAVEAVAGSACRGILTLGFHLD